MSDTLDILTIEEGRTAINMPTGTSDHDTEIAQQITAVSRMIDAACGPVVHRTVTAEVHHATSTLWLKHSPVVSVSLVRTAAGGTITELDPVTFGGTTDGYDIDLTSGRLSRSYGGSVASWGYGQVEVTYVAGRYATTAVVDARFKTCAASVLRRLWKRESGTWAQSSNFFEGADSDPGGIGFFRVAQPIIDEMLADERLLPGIA